MSPSGVAVCVVVTVGVAVAVGVVVALDAERGASRRLCLRFRLQRRLVLRWFCCARRTHGNEGGGAATWATREVMRSGNEGDVGGGAATRAGFEISGRGKGNNKEGGRFVAVLVCQ